MKAIEKKHNKEKSRGALRFSEARSHVAHELSSSLSPNKEINSDHNPNGLHGIGSILGLKDGAPEADYPR